MGVPLFREKRRSAYYMTLTYNIWALVVWTWMWSCGMHSRRRASDMMHLVYACTNEYTDMVHRERWFLLPHPPSRSFRSV